MQKLYPKFAGVALAKLDNNRDFLAQSYIFQCGLSFLIDNIDNNQLMVSQVAKVASASYFVSGRSIEEQMDASVFYFCRRFISTFLFSTCVPVERSSCPHAGG